MKRWLQIGLILLGVAIFVYMVVITGADALAAILNGERRYLLMALLATGAAQMLSGWRLQVALAAAGNRQLPWRATYHVTLTAQLIGMVVPRILSAVGGKAAALKVYEVDLKRSVPAVLLDNLFDVLVMAPLMLPGFLYATGQLSTSGLITSYGLLAGAFLLLVSWAPAGPQTLRHLNLERIPRLGDSLSTFCERIVQVWPTGQQGRALVLLTAALNGLLAVRFYYIGLALGMETSFIQFLALFPMAQLSLIVALAPGGLGIFDLSWLGLLLLVGAEGAENFAVAQRIYVTVINLFWGCFAILLALTLPRPTVIEELP